MNAAAAAAATETPVTTQTGYRLHRRFDRLGRLVGDDAMARLAKSHVLVLGLGGVGSFAVEALVRSGVGRITLVDFDRVCVTNTNRQLQALSTTVAKPKADVLAERVRAIVPNIEVQALATFYGPATADRILRLDPHYIVDAIDNITAKCHLLNECRERGLRAVSTLGSAGRMDPLQVKVTDLAQTKQDPFAHSVRRVLRQEYNFPRRGTFGLTAVWSSEPALDPHELAYDTDGFRCVCPGGKNEHHSCEERSLVRGSASFVTGTFGLVAASHVVRQIVSGAVAV